MARTERGRALQRLRFVTLVLAALGLVMGGAHALELIPRMRYDAELYTRITSTMYWVYGSVGAAIQVAALISAGVLTVLARGLPSFRFTLLGTLALLASLVLWGALVAPVNAHWMQVLEASPTAAPAAYFELRPRWEYGHLVAFAAWLVGYCLLLASVLARRAQDRRESGMA